MATTIARCTRCGGSRWAGLAPVCAACRDGYAEDVRQAAIGLTTAYLEDARVTLDELKPRFLELIEALDGLRPAPPEASGAGEV